LDVDSNKILVGGIPGYFDSFVNNEIDLDADAIPASKVLSNNTVTNFSSHKSPFALDTVTSSSLKTAFMTNEGHAFPSVAERFGWTRLLDCCHFALQILTAWHGTSDAKQFQSDVYDILDTPSVDNLSSLLKQALAKYRTKKTQVLLKKITNKQHQLCYAHTCNAFTAGHVSDQRVEQGMAAMKANGKLKSYLSGCTYGEAVSRISQLARDQDFTALKELQLCRENHKKVGLKYANVLMNSKAAAMNFSCVEKTSELCITKFFVKVTDSKNACCEVDLDTTVSWRGGHFQIVTGTCSYYLSTRMMCPCACAAMQRIGMDIDKIENVHPFIAFGITHYGRRQSNHYNCLILQGFSFLFCYQFGAYQQRPCPRSFE
jgi:hypothetical protein